MRALSNRTERRAGLLAALAVLAVTAGAGAALALGFGIAHRIILGPAFVAVWAGLGLALAFLTAARARARAGRYTVGIDIDDDAYAPTAVTLVRRRGAGYELAIAPGMTGFVERRGARPMPLGSAERSRVALGEGAFAEVSIGKTTFSVRSIAPRAGRVDLPTGFWRPLVRRTFAPIGFAALATFLTTVPAGAMLTEHDMRSAIPADASPWEVEKLLRQEAQLQASTLHACFDPLPYSCQHPGYVGVGVSLAKDGEIRTSWIARSTYGQDCPVDACMSKVVSDWFFEPLPEAMRIVLPVQVLRTNKPLPQHLLHASASLGDGVPSAAPSVSSLN
ncbi:MAG TPA: hypothetical protein VHJ20_17775 [Polyangia bacterium]|nr:hypothetical protein [Polyangia bacterium]